MEAMQDKNIREKINSLDSLPDGYVPSLESKWELLQAGKPEKKRNFPYFWYAAACVLLAGFAWLLSQQDNQKEKQFFTNQKVAVNKEIQPLNPLPIARKPEKSFVEEANNESKPKSIRKNGIVSTLKSKKVRQIEINTGPELLEENSELEIKPVLLQPEQIATVSKKNSPKKHRFVEVDFDTPADQVRLPQATQTAQIQVKLKLLPEVSASAPAENDPLKPFRLQHTF